MSGATLGPLVGPRVLLYNTDMGVAQLVQESAILRRNQAAILDDDSPAATVSDS